VSALASLAGVLPPTALAFGEAIEDERVASLGHLVGAAPEAVVRPESTDDVAATMRWASASGVAVLPVASARRVHGGTSREPYIVLVTDRLRGIDIYEPADLTLTAGAGTPMVELAEQLEPHAQWLPFDPPHVESRSLGGLIATGESGPIWMGYGELRNHVLGATVVTGDGRTLKLGGRVVKNVAGFDLLRPMVGSRGRLGVITSVCVRAFPRPEVDCVLVARAGSARELYGAALGVGTAPVMPVSSVLIEPAGALGAAAALVVRVHGSKATVAADHRTLERYAGVQLERVLEAEPVLSAARDQATEGVVLTVRVLPRHFGSAIDTVRAAGTVEIAADTYMAVLRIAAPGGFSEPGRVATLREQVERLGGTLSVHPDPGDWSSAARPHEIELAAGLERVFDPHGVLRMCRT
jgi:FAD/FMN-containing dehydrogenase